MNIHCKYDSLVGVNSLKPHPKNRNKHPDEQIERLAKILKYQGVRAPIVVSRRSGKIVKGHGTLQAIKKNGWQEAPIVIQDFEDDDQEWLFVQSDNAIANWAELDLKGINADLSELGPFDIDLIGIKDFEVEPLDKFLGDEDAVPDVKPTDIQLGDLFVLGDHRLLCGDSTDAAQVERLMNGEKADMVFTDPPYGVDYDGGAFTKRKKLQNDQKQTSIYELVIPNLNKETKNHAAIYIWYAAGYADMATYLWKNNLEIRSQIVWNKNLAQFGALSAQYKQKHEPCFYCHKKSYAPQWFGPTNEVTVWDFDRESKNEFHPTQKPVSLAERALKNSSKTNDIVIDLFGGSGSTLIACEKTNRKCFMMELDPQYCQVIIDRWEQYTGKKAVKHGSPT